MNIRLAIDGTPVDATLNDSAAARDFAAQLPLTLNLTDFHQAEKIADLPRRLSTSGAPDGAAPAPATSPTTRRGATSPSSTAAVPTPPA